MLCFKSGEIDQKLHSCTMMMHNHINVMLQMFLWKWKRSTLEVEKSFGSDILEIDSGPPLICSVILESFSHLWKGKFYFLVLLELNKITYVKWLVGFLTIAGTECQFFNLFLICYCEWVKVFKGFIEMMMGFCLLVLGKFVGCLYYLFTHCCLYSCYSFILVQWLSNYLDLFTWYTILFQKLENNFLIPPFYWNIMKTIIAIYFHANFLVFGW